MSIEIVDSGRMDGLIGDLVFYRQFCSACLFRLGWSA